MVETPSNRRNQAGIEPPGAAATAPELKAWFVREVLPLEAALMQFLRRSWRNDSDADDFCQDVYARVCEVAREKIPSPAKPLVFTIARNLLIDRVRHENVVSIEAVADTDALASAADAPGPDRAVMAREELHLLQAALNGLPQRCREAVVMKKIEGLSRSEIATRMGISEKTVKRHLADGMCALAQALYGERAEPRRPR
jgi:RNA polymerase sigma factor (sigma-70 family)